ncbi:hypothetical protein AWB78_01520 [Caballeronia calidae]|uniref:Uncharacterized protein n=1 Tax=Caballeronia calidae TaxID=1777139 RepID=A0A158ADN5_9BURK|nr:DUF2335 domain-containing protein [Caballeronia calidae]SAK55948.1 hypothetical protein AWB78_01520 [Caballeronia calidae]
MNEIARDSKVRYIAEPVPADVAEPVIAAGKASVTVAVQTHSFRGPMPPPEHLAQYDRIVPGAGRLIVEEFQMNSQHAREIETLGLRGSIRKDIRAQFIAGFLVLIGFGLVYGLAEHNHDGVAIAVAVTLLVSVLTAFLTGTVMRGKGDAGIKEAVDN